MAQEMLVKKSLVLAVEEGTDENGKAIIKKYTYSNVKRTATPESLFEAADALESLHKGPADYSTVDTHDLIL